MEHFYEVVEPKYINYLKPKMSKGKTNLLIGTLWFGNTSLVCCTGSLQTGRWEVLSTPFSPNWGPNTECFVDKNVYRLTCCQLLTNGLRASVYISQIFHPCTGWGAQLLGGLFKNQECQPSTCISKPWNTKVRTCMIDVQLPIVL